MDAADVIRAAVIAIAPHIPNAVVTAAAARYPERLVAIGSIDPLAPDALDALDRAVTADKVRAIKVHPRLQRIRFEHLDALAAVARRCAHHHVPLVVCSFLGGPDLYTARTLELCHELARSSPDTALVLAHAGGYRPLDALMILKANKNVHVDLSFSPVYFRGSSVVQDLAYLIQRADPRRVLFGSDFPEAPIADSIAFVAETARSLKLTESHVDAIMHENATRLLGA